jgi:hypothetical protein
MSSGWIVEEIDLAPLERKLAAMIEAGRLPAGLSVGAVLGLARAYHNRRHGEDMDKMKPSDALAWIEATQRAADALSVRLWDMPDAVQGALTIARARMGRTDDPAEDARAVLLKLAGMLEMARREIDEAEGPRAKGGRPSALSGWLTIRLSEIVERAGVPADATPSGALVQALGEVLAAVGEDRAKPAEIARKALKLR